MMTLNRFFCMSTKPSKKLTAHKSNRTNNNNNTNSNEGTLTVPETASKNNQNDQHMNSDGNRHLLQDHHDTPKLPYKFVVKRFDAVLPDELSVRPGDVVKLEDVDEHTTDGKIWFHVILLDGAGKEGFVPAEILSDKPYHFPRCRKKLPRSNTLIDTSHRHSHHHPHHHPSEHHHSHTLRIPHYASENTCHSNGDSIRGLQHIAAHLHPFGVPPPNSLQGSSGCQTFQKAYYPDMRNFTPPAYHNVQPSLRLPLQYDTLHLTEFQTREIEECLVIHNFIAREENDLTVKPGDFVIVLNKDDEDWTWVKMRPDETEGFVPSKFIVPRDTVDLIMNKGNSTITMKSSNQIDHTYINHRPERDSLPTDQQSSSFQQM